MKLIYGIVPVVVIGVILGLAFAGIINIPGVTPKKAAKHAAANYAPDKDAATPKLASNPIPSPPAAKKPPAPEVKPIHKDPDQGAESLATVWNEIKTPELIAISANWKDDEFAKVLAKMDTDKVAKLLDAMAKGDGDKQKPDPKRASKLSKILQDQGAVVKEEAAETQ